MRACGLPGSKSSGLVFLRHVTIGGLGGSSPIIRGFKQSEFCTVLSLGIKKEGKETAKKLKLKRGVYLRPHQRDNSRTWHRHRSQRHCGRSWEIPDSVPLQGKENDMLCRLTLSVGITDQFDGMYHVCYVVIVILYGAYIW